MKRLAYLISTFLILAGMYGGSGLAQSVGYAPNPALSKDVEALDYEFWISIKESKNPAEFEEYLKVFPKGIYAGLVRARRAPLPGLRALAPRGRRAPRRPPRAPAPPRPSPRRACLPSRRAPRRRIRSRRPEFYQHNFGVFEALSGVAVEQFSGGLFVRSGT